MLRRTPPARTAGPKRKKGLAPCSRERRAQQQVQRVAYAGAEDAGQCWCSACGCPNDLQHAHLYTQKLYPQHRANKLNWLVLCGDCHRCQENNKPLFAKKYPEAWAEIIRRMQLVDLKAYEFYAATTPELYP